MPRRAVIVLISAAITSINHLPATISCTRAMSTNAQQRQRQMMMESRLRGALWGMFSGDALASPTHWYYGGYAQVQSDYGRGGITGYAKPVTNLPGSILNKSDPNGGGRSKKTWFVGASEEKRRDVTIVGDVINHGKLPHWDPNKSIHYHATLQSGENTLEMQIARVLMRSIASNGGRFDEDHFRDAYVRFMTTSGSHNDTYASTCHRMFFANMVFGGRDPRLCPDNDGHNVDTIDGLVLPTVTALAETARRISISGWRGVNGDGVSAQDLREIRAASARTAAVTRSSNVLERASEAWSSLVCSALIAPTDDGKGNALEEPLRDLARELGMATPRPDGRDQMSACYLSQSLPPTLDMIFKYTQPSYANNDEGASVWRALLANANVGGENVHRGAVLGAVLGARSGDDNLPSVLKSGLHERELLEKEIDDFVSAVMRTANRSGTSLDGEL